MADQVQQTTIPDNHSVIHQDLQASLADLAHKHVNISYTLCGIVLVVVLLMVCGGIFANKIYEKEVARAEAAEKVSEEARQQMEADKHASDLVLQQATAQINADAVQRQQDAAKIASLEQSIKARDAKAAATIAGILQVNKSAKDAYADADAHYKLKSPLVAGKDAIGNETLTFLIPDVQQFSATKVDDDTKIADLQAKTQELASAQNSVTSLTADLKVGTAAFQALQKTENQCETTVTDQRKTIADYKKAAQVGRWRRIWDGAQKVGLVAVGIYLGHKF